MLFILIILTGSIFIIGGGKALHDKPIEYRARPDSTLCVVRLLQELRYANKRISENIHVFIRDSGRKVHKNAAMMKELGKLIGLKDWERLTSHGNRKKGVTDAAKAGSGSLHNKLVMTHARHKCITSQNAYLKPGKEERESFFNALDGKEEVPLPQKEEETGGIWEWFGGIWRSAKGVFSFSECKDMKEKGSSLIRSDLMNENNELLEFIKGEGLLDKYLTVVARSKKGEA